MSIPTFDDYYQMGRCELLVRQRRLVCREGDVSDTGLRSSAAMADLLTGWAAGRVASTFLDGNRGDDLTLEARDRGVERRAAVPAIGTITLSRLSGAVPRIVPAGTRIATVADSTGAFVTVATDVDISFGIGVVLLTGAATAIASGRVGNVVAGTLTRVLDRVLDPLPEVFTATNAALFVGGDEAEADEDLIDRTKGAWQNAARGTARALAHGAKVAGAYTASVTRDTTTNIVTVYVADRDGNANDVLIAKVQPELDTNWSGGADVVVVVGGVMVPTPIEVELTVRAGVAIPPLVAFVRAAIVAAWNRNTIGGTGYRTSISAAGRSVSADIVDCEVTTPAANIATSAGQVLRTTAELVEVG